MISVLQSYVKDEKNIIEYSKDGISVSHVIKTPNGTDRIWPIEYENRPTIEQQILAELQYNTALTEMKMLGGM